MECCGGFNIRLSLLIMLITFERFVCRWYIPFDFVSISLLFLFDSIVMGFVHFII